jgi:hypothetical protein
MYVFWQALPKDISCTNTSESGFVKIDVLRVWSICTLDLSGHLSLWHIGSAWTLFACLFRPGKLITIVALLTYSFHPKKRRKKHQNQTKLLVNSIGSSSSLEEKVGDELENSLLEPVPDRHHVNLHLFGHDSGRTYGAEVEDSGSSGRNAISSDPFGRGCGYSSKIAFLVKLKSFCKVYGYGCGCFLFCRGVVRDQCHVCPWGRRWHHRP